MQVHQLLQVFCSHDASQRARLVLVFVRVLLVRVVLLLLLVFVLVQSPGLLLPVCVLGLRGGCLGA